MRQSQKVRKSAQARRVPELLDRGLFQFLIDFPVHTYHIIMSVERPPELQIDAKLDRCIDLSLRRFVYGAGVGVVGAMLLFKRPSTRSASVAFGAGVGLGTAYTECQPELERFFNVNLPK